MGQRAILIVIKDLFMISFQKYNLEKKMAALAVAVRISIALNWLLTMNSVGIFLGWKKGGDRGKPRRF